MKPRITPPKPGIYEDVPEATYHSWDAFSNSQAGDIRKSPGHLKHRLDNPVETRPMLIGQATHYALLQRHKFKERFYKIPPGNGQKKEVKEARAQAIKDNPGKVGLKEAELVKIVGMMKSLNSKYHSACRKLIDAATHHEISVVWKNEATGILCKARMDAYIEPARVMIDLKTTSKGASFHEFQKTMAYREYYRQPAVYQEGFGKQGFPIERAVFIAVETDGMYAMKAWEMKEDELFLARDEWTQACKLYHWCKSRNDWPLHHDDVEYISLPEWKLKELTGEIG